MKRLAKGFLVVAGVWSAMSYAINAALSALFGMMFYTSGLSLTISGLNSYQYAIEQGYDPSSYIAMFSAGIGLLAGGTVFVVIMAITNAFLFLAAIWPLVNVVSLNDKKAGYIISIVVGALTLLMASFWIGLLVILGGVFGLIALKKEKQAQLELGGAK